LTSLVDRFSNRVVPDYDCFPIGGQGNLIARLDPSFWRDAGGCIGVEGKYPLPKDAAASIMGASWGWKIMLVSARFVSTVLALAMLFAAKQKTSGRLLISRRH
jgi:hypothetical protein